MRNYGERKNRWEIKAGVEAGLANGRSSHQQQQYKTASDENAREKTPCTKVRK